MPELFIEILSEEIPARMQARAADDFKRLVTERLKKNELSFDAAECYVTPRRVILHVTGLPTAQPDVREERRGPRVGSPEQAINGFLGSIGLTIDDLEQREAKKGTFYFAVIERKGQPAADVLPALVLEALEAMPWPKSMRWGSSSTRWVRPMQGLVCLFGGAVVPVEFAGITSGNTTVGHRFMAPDTITVTDFAGYREALKKAYVEIDRNIRREQIARDADKLAQDAGLAVMDNKALLEEVAGLVEWPVTLMGTIDDKFMDVPAEALVSSMAKHQKYFSLEDSDGKMAPNFIVVSNMETPDNGQTITAGNERVLRARLSDAKFFWDQDRKTTLESRVGKLENRIFHARLGTDLERVNRIVKLAGRISSNIEGADKGKVERAALLCKADLTTEMVGEFPDLQGLMGRYYALGNNEDAIVAEAIAEHYAPKGPTDNCPNAPVSVAVALADKIDMLVGFWLIDQKPTGSKDPFALRRAALGVIRLIVENGLRMPLMKVFAFARKLYLEQAKEEIAKAILEKSGEQKQHTLDREMMRNWSVVQMDDLLGFFAERLKVHLKGEGVRHDLISAIFEKEGDLEDDFVRLLARVDALKDFLDSDDGANLLVAYRRAANIVRIEAKKDGLSYEDAPELALFEQDEENTLLERLAEVRTNSGKSIEGEKFEKAMEQLARLRAPVDAFFEHVTVNCDAKDKRANRLKLLSAIDQAMGGVANFSKIEG